MGMFSWTEKSPAVLQNGGVIGMRTADRYPPLFVESTQNLRPGGVTEARS